MIHLKILSQIDLDRSDFDKLPNPENVPSDSLNDLSTIITIVFGIAGAVALLVIVLAGLQYILSRGDPQKTASAKNTIIYALVGLALVVLAQAIVVFVVNSL